MKSKISLRPASDHDTDFIFKVYSDTRADEMAVTGWSEQEINSFLVMQFDLQKRHYDTYYAGADFSIILMGDKPAGRLYVHRTSSEIRIIDIALLLSFRRMGIGSELLKQLIKESEDKNIPLTLHVEFNNPVREYYQQLGFSEGELRGVYYFMERKPDTLKTLAFNNQQGG